MDPRKRDDRTTMGADGRAVASNRRSVAVAAVLLFLALILVVDGIAGERGWLVNRRGQRELEQAQQALDQVKWENARRRDLIERLRSADPATIEEIARRERGFIRPGEKLFIVRDAPQPKR
jgi:cell division protein FtsB